MTSPAAGIAFALWLRLRWGGALTVAYLVCLAIAARFVPNAPETIIMALLLVAASIAHLLHVFTLGPADLGVKSSGYPAHMFVLPVETRYLSAWPILYGAGTFAALWVIIVWFVLVPCGISPPALWPAAIVAACTAWVQAISWSPFPTVFARVPALALTTLPLILVGSWAGMFLETQGLVAAVVIVFSLTWMALAYYFAVRGLSRARCGAEYTWTLLPVETWASIADRLSSAFSLRRPFPSASAAQLWHECRRNVIFMPAMVAFIGLPLLVLNCLGVTNPDPGRTMLFGTISVTPATMSLLIWLFVPMMLAMSLGQGLGKFDIFGKDAMPSFFAIHPMATTHFVIVKFVAALISSLATWLIVLTLLAIWALVEISPLNPQPSFLLAAIFNATPRGVVLALAAAFGIVALTWRLIATGMWPSLAGRKMVSNGIAIGSWAQLAIGMIIASWIYRHPEVQPPLRDVLPWAFCTLLLLKFALAAWAMCWILEIGLVQRRTMLLFLAGWWATAGGLFAFLSFLNPPSWPLAGAVLYLLPLARIALALLALHYNRHR